MECGGSYNILDQGCQTNSFGAGSGPNLHLCGPQKCNTTLFFANDSISSSKLVVNECSNSEVWRLKLSSQLQLETPKLLHSVTTNSELLIGLFIFHTLYKLE